ncbi:MAG: arginine deiminase-related protein [bacterium]
MSPSIAECELTHLERVPIDVTRAEAQHAEYEATLRSLGVTVVRVAAAPALPDAVFIEDTAIVLDEIALVTRPGARARRAELDAVRGALMEYRPVIALDAPATLDGGDVLRVDRTLYVGRSGRTNDEGIEQLRRLVRAYDYEVVPVAFSGCLHLKSAVTEVADRVLLLNPAWVHASAFSGCEVVEVAEGEPFAANGLRIENRVIYSSQYPLTRDALVQRGVQPALVDSSELAKAEGAVTCCSLVFTSS